MFTPTFDRSIRLRTQFFDEKFSPEQLVFILPIAESDFAEKVQVSTLVLFV